jgi:hypothetical protein
MMGLPALLVTLCLALIFLLYVGLAQVECSFSQVMQFLRDQRTAADTERSGQEELPGKTDRLPFRPKVQ